MSSDVLVVYKHGEMFHVTQCEQFTLHPVLQNLMALETPCPIILSHPVLHVVNALETCCFGFQMVVMTLQKAAQGGTSSSWFMHQANKSSMVFGTCYE